MRSTKVDTGIGSVRCAECDREVDEVHGDRREVGVLEQRVGELVPFCPECARREFADDALAGELKTSAGRASELGD